MCNTSSCTEHHVQYFLLHWAPCAVHPPALSTMCNISSCTEHHVLYFFLHWTLWSKLLPALNTMCNTSSCTEHHVQYFFLHWTICAKLQLLHWTPHVKLLHPAYCNPVKADWSFKKTGQKISWNIKNLFLTSIAHKTCQGDFLRLIKSLLNITLTPLVLLKKIQIFTVFLQKEKKGMNMTI